MQSIFLLLTFFWLCPQVSAQKPTNVYYIDARRLTVVGQPLPYLQKPFSRMDGRAYGLKGSLAAKAAQSTGIAVLFTTNSRTIRAKWHTSNLRVVGTNTGANCQKGLDLYIRKKGKWLFAGVGAPNMKGNCADHEAILVASMDEDVKECLLYLPLFDWGRGKGQVRVARSNRDLVYPQVEQNRTDFELNVRKLVKQFNLQTQRVRIAARTDETAQRRSEVARKLYLLGKSTILDSITT